MSERARAAGEDGEAGAEGEGSAQQAEIAAVVDVVVVRASRHVGEHGVRGGCRRASAVQADWNCLEVQAQRILELVLSWLAFITWNCGVELALHYERG